MQPFFSPTSLDLIAEQQRVDPRLIAAAGYPAPKPRRKPRQFVGNLLVRLGQWTAGKHLEHIPEAATTTA